MVVIEPAVIKFPVKYSELQVKLFLLHDNNLELSLVPFTLAW